MLIRYGDKVMCMLEDENGEELPLSVTECISAGLKQDGLQFHNPLHRKVLKEAENHITEEGFVAEHFFLSHPDPAISLLAAEMVSDRYQLSKYHYKGQKIVSDEERLYELVPRLLVDFKLSIVEEEMRHTLQSLADPQIANNPQRCTEIMEHYRDLQQVQSAMAKRAGDRVVISY